MAEAWESVAVLMPALAALTATVLEQEKLLCALQLVREALMKVNMESRQTGQEHTAVFRRLRLGHPAPLSRKTHMF